MAQERLYLVTYDIADPKRWRRVYRTMNGYGQWLQLSVFQCRLTARRRIGLGTDLDAVIDRTEDHVLIIDLGPAAAIAPKIESLGKSYTAPERRAIII